MKQYFKVNRQSLLQALKALKALKPSNIIEETQGALFELKGSKLHVSATNVEINLAKIVSIESYSEKILFAVADRNRILEALQKIKDENVEFAHHGLDYPVILEHSKGYIKFGVIKPDDMPFRAGDQDFAFSAELLDHHVQGINKAAKFTSTNELKAGLYYVHLCFKKDCKVNIEASNGHYAYRKSGSYLNTENKDFSILIPTDALRFIEAGDLFAFKKGNRIKIENDNTILVFENDSYLQYPDFDKIIRDKSPVKFTVQKKELEEAIGLCSLTAEQNTKAVFLDIDNHQLRDNELQSKADSMCKVKALEIWEDSNSSLQTIAFNYELFLKLSKEIEDQIITLEMQAKSMAIEIRTTANEVFLLMPVLPNYGK